MLKTRNAKISPKADMELTGPSPDEPEIRLILMMENSKIDRQLVSL